ncbi:MAG: hypothetical protein PVF34_11555 [Gammaproteobacteria bacterium]|jgi:hypothetical protein
MSRDAAQLNIVTALPEEARPLIHCFRLKRRHDIHPFPVYENADIQLIVSGIGKTAAATATGYLARQHAEQRYTAWLNIGIAGGKQFDTGQCLLAHQVTDSDQQRNYYPTLWFDNTLKTARVFTANVPETNYGDDALYDMEAAAFYGAAMHFSTVELIHCCKIVSDNREVTIDQITSSSVVNSIEQNLKPIQQLVEQLLRGAGRLNDDFRGQDELEILRDRYHFTTVQQSQLNTILQKWFALTDQSPLQLLDLEGIKNAKRLLQELDTRLNEFPVHY